jgi:hypothetical protein
LSEDDGVTLSTILASEYHGRPVARIQGNWYFSRAQGGDAEQHAELAHRRIAQIKEKSWSWRLDSLEPCAGKGLDTENYYVYSVGIIGEEKPDDKSTSFQVVGTCPKCKADVAGTMVFWDGRDSRGSPVSGAEYRATCKCGASLQSREVPHIETSRVTWQAVETMVSER